MSEDSKGRRHGGLTNNVEVVDNLVMVVIVIIIVVGNLILWETKSASNLAFKIVSAKAYVNRGLFAPIRAAAIFWGGCPALRRRREKSGIAALVL